MSSAKETWDSVEPVYVTLRKVGVICETPSQYLRLIKHTSKVIQSEIVGGQVKNFYLEFVHYQYPEQVLKDNIYQLAIVTDWDIPSSFFKPLIDSFIEARGGEYGNIVRKALKIPDSLNYSQRLKEREEYNRVKVFGEIG